MLPGRPGRGYYPAAREVNFGQPGRFFPTFSVHDFFWHFFFHSSEYNHNFGGRTAGKTVGGKFQSWVLDENLSGYLFTEHNPSLSWAMDGVVMGCLMFVWLRTDFPTKRVHPIPYTK